MFPLYGHLQHGSATLNSTISLRFGCFWCFFFFLASEDQSQSSYCVESGGYGGYYGTREQATNKNKSFSFFFDCVLLGFQMTNSRIVAKFFKCAMARKYSSRRMEPFHLVELEQMGALCSLLEQRVTLEQDMEFPTL